MLFRSYTLSLNDALPISEERRVGKECSIREASKKLSGTTKDIEKFMQKDDKRKEDFCKRFMGVDWADMTKYNLCLDNGTLGYEKCVEEIESALEILKK